MILSDGTIEERLALPDDDIRRIRLNGMHDDAMQGASVDLYLAPGIVYRKHKIILSDGETWLLPPHGACLGSSIEYIHTPADCVCRVEGNSTNGRQFVIAHCTAGWGDPGWYGNMTLEIVNLDPDDHFAMWAGMRICQLTFLQLDKVAKRQYKGRYQGDLGVQGAKP